MSDYHDPVLLKTSVDAMIQDPGGIYMDMTYGGGGHSKEILSRLTSKGKLVVFDQDEDARQNLLADDRLVFIQSNFRYLYRYWKWMGIEKIDGLLADLGVSSYQFDEQSRGFSYRFDAGLDMRMNTQAGLTAEIILNSYDEEQLKSMFSEYGEIRNAKTLAKEIVRQRVLAGGIGSSAQLNQMLERLKIGDRLRYFSQVYQALRIEVNDEMNALKDMLEASVRVVKPGGRIVMISYHSLEDRLVKNFFRSGNFSGKQEKDMYGQPLSPIRQVGKLIQPDLEEQKRNSRSRSAKMRVAEIKKE